MSQSVQSSGEHQPDENRRDFLTLATTAVGVVGAGCALLPFVDSMNPSKDVLALASVEVNISNIPVGQAIKVMWRGKPVFIRHRTEREITEAEEVSLNELVDPQTDASRVEKKEWLIVVGVCTHLGCIPMGTATGEPRGDYDGWYCPCHGSHYDSSGRIRKGPAPANLVVPEYTFVSDTTVKIG
ncbi:ubiquinol-cytochrome c reductase iron-sulfur subunit [Thalassospira lucentensis]|uniref:ubiquinol-cytochrome c reductase iron-sulfur subunit n=1 Tax=Thalassospira lucentensis TaxID=168935 RepID=UPI00142D9875|nr:ubiquinol-cytochrome c reductase iron-sulfur subunit [Thalassospira lucentensis]NIZ00107.1 ubiquinol-cytochrome c reductase iron-sulfur subunit [Thalassospira lucentensis]